MRSAIQLYTLRDLDEPVPELVARVGETAFDGVEFAGLGDADPSEVRDALDDAGLDAAAAHVGVEALEDDFEATVEAYRRLGCDRLVVPYLDETHFVSRDRATETAQLLAALDGRLGERGLALAYHNHDHEFVAVGDTTAYDLLVDETDLALELDAGWATAAGRDPTDLLARLPDRAPLVHLKDVAGDRPVELGDGDLDAAGCVRAAREAGTEWLVYEHDDPDDPEASLARGAEAVAGLLG